MTNKTLLPAAMLVALFLYGSPCLAQSAAQSAIDRPLIDVFDAEQMTNAILNSSLVSSTSTEFFGPVLEFSSSTPIAQIESSTTTLSIEAPFIKQWQATGGLTQMLSLNAKSDQVLLLQGALKGLIPEFKPGYITSYFGPKTQEAVKLFQVKYKITPANGVVGPKTRDLLNQKFLNDLCPQKAGAVKLYENLNRTNSIALDYTPPGLQKLPAAIRTAGVICLTYDPATQLQSLFKDARKAGIQLIVLSGYRRPEIQELLLAWSNKNNIKSSDEELLSLAEVGHSEHQLGTTVDLGAKSQGFMGPYMSFGDTAEGKWLQSNSYRYGFIMSYPEGKENITGYVYEPWHFRYVGLDTAKDIHDKNISIEEYLSQMGTSTNLQS
jgi:LAS superfamily LD-carboxypeptidase LdcB